MASGCAWGARGAAGAQQRVHRAGPQGAGPPRGAQGSGTGRFLHARGRSTAFLLYTAAWGQGGVRDGEVGE